MVSKELTLKAPLDREQNQNTLVGFWAGIFQEIPTCADQACGEVAVEVDPFFPYLDDYNRCEGHSAHDPSNTMALA